MRMTFRHTQLCVCVATALTMFACSKKDSTPVTPPAPVNPVVTPAVSSLSPSEGAANTVVSINGTGFGETIAGDSVFFNGVKAELTGVSPTRLDVKVPLGAGTGKVTVYVNGKPITGPVFTYDSSYVVSLLAGSGTFGYVDATGKAASFYAPTDVVADASGNVYVTDNGNDAIRKITPDGVVTTLAGGHGEGFADGVGIDAHFGYISGIAIDKAGNLYVADGGNSKIRKITPAGLVSTLAGSSSGDADGTGTAAAFSGPHGIDVDKDGNVYVSDAGNNKIRKITPAGVVTTLAGTGEAGGNDGPGTSATFNSPIGLAVDHNGNVYVAEGNVPLIDQNGMHPGNNKIRKITPDGTVSTFAGSGNNGAANGVGTAASFTYPYGLRCDSDGNLFVTEVTNNDIRKITPGGEVSTFAGLGWAGADNGTLDVATFKGPTGITIDSKGNFYVADLNNLMIRKIALQ